VDAQGHARARAVVELDAGDRPHRDPADLHLVAAHELARVLEDRVDAVRAGGAEQEERDDHHRESDRRDRDQTSRDLRPPPHRHYRLLPWTLSSAARSQRSASPGAPLQRAVARARYAAAASLRTRLSAPRA